MVVCYLSLGKLVHSCTDSLTSDESKMRLSLQHLRIKVASSH